VRNFGKEGFPLFEKEGKILTIASTSDYTEVCGSTKKEYSELVLTVANARSSVGNNVNHK
jgi:hypothetical protein